MDPRTNNYTSGFYFTFLYFKLDFF
ncbi:unnamed protein product [Leptidea sinapis]|uniref:Uncharacterized protein n=1 Tax=Leptidea sinapis TaxID=189913 RepID=A0A5E4R3R0_9NEOP|nr:unnamed protein product [Leptidea sinapis]